MSIAEKLATIAENVPKVYDAGKQETTYNIFKAMSTDYQNLNRTDWRYAFSGWNFSGVGGFNPPFTIKPTSGDYMFQRASYIGVITKDDLDTSNLTSASYMFQYANSSMNLKDVCEIEEFCATKLSSMTNVFWAFYGLKRLGKLILKENGSQDFTYTFNMCNKLTDIDSIEGVIGRTIAFPSSTLTPNSMKVIINALADYSTENTLTYTVTFKSDCWTALEAESTAPDGGTWKNYVYNVKGWNY